MSSHTPGPWEFCKDDIVPQLGDFIAYEISPYDPKNYRPLAYVADIYDARLMTAAPDLLSAAKQAKTAMSLLCGTAMSPELAGDLTGHVINEGMRIIKELGEAIEKAEGDDE